MIERNKVSVEDIIGLVQTDEETDSVEEVRKLRGRKKETEKRFTVKQRQGATIYSINDYYGQLPLSEGMYYKSNAEKLCKWLNNQHDLLNAFYKENEQLKQRITYLERKIQRERVSSMKEHEKWEKELKATIKEAYNTERTMIGKSVLKQLMETIQ